MSMAVKGERIKCQKVSVINVARSGRLGKVSKNIKKRKKKHNKGEGFVSVILSFLFGE